ncbi:hypothetical protein BHE74_00049800, partial [Ensete ventricosum]
SDFVIGLASGSRKLRGLWRLEAVAALPRAGLPGLGPLTDSVCGGAAEGADCPPSSAKMLEPNLVPAQWVRSAPVAAGGNCWFRPLCASSPVVVSGRSRCSARWMDPSYPVAGVGCWSGGVRVRRRHLRSGREPALAKRSGRVSS